MSKRHTKSKKNVDISIVGCMPNPIGGVSTFCNRLVNQISKKSNKSINFYDLYSGNKITDSLESNIKLFELGNTTKYISLAFLKLFFFLLYRRSEVTFFNFSKVDSLYLVAFILFACRPKNSYLCLHHGHLSTDNIILDKLTRYCLSKCSYIYALNNNQAKFYKKHTNIEKIIVCNSYLAPIVLSDYRSENKKTNKLRVLISGNSLPHYNIISTIEALSMIAMKVKNINFEITVSIYGESSCFIDRVKKIALSNVNLDYKFTHDLSEEKFLDLLRVQDLYIRNTQIDSFGIIVADAINLGVDVIASDVCERYQGCMIYRYNNSVSFVDTMLNYINNKSINKISKTKILSFPIDSLFNNS